MEPKVTKNLVRWELKVPSALDKQVETAIKQGLYASKSDLIRDAVRKILGTVNETKAIQTTPGVEGRNDG